MNKKLNQLVIQQQKRIYIRKMINQIILYSIIATFIGISQSAGVGGGPVLNICLMVGANYSAKESMSITYVFLMGGSIASIIKNYKKMLPETRSYIVDYDLIIITLPMIASGSIMGTLSNHFLSQLTITIFFIIVLTYICINTYNKIKAISSGASEDKKQTLLAKSTQLQVLGLQIEKSQNPELDKIIEEQLKPLPWGKIRLALLFFIYTLGVLLIKGGQSYDSFIGINSCGLLGNVLVFCHLGLSLYFSNKIGNQIIQKDLRKENFGFVYAHESQKMSEKKKWNSIVSGFFAGLLGGTLGLGGAIILVPVWLNSGINQTKVVSTSPPLIFFSAMISFCICLLSGRYKNFMQLCFYFGLAYIGSAVVKSVAQYIAQKLQLKSIILILLLITMASSLVTLVPYQLFKFISDPEQFVDFGKFC